MHDSLKAFKQYYETFDLQSFEGLDDIYSEDVVFSDPIHKIYGRRELKRYFQYICRNLSGCRFHFYEEVIGEYTAFFKWSMHYQHPSIANDSPLELLGTTFIRYSDKVEVHEDYYDMGAMLYEHVTILGRVIKMIKSKMSRHHL